MKKAPLILILCSVLSTNIFAASFPLKLKLSNSACMGYPTCNKGTPGYSGCTFIFTGWSSNGAAIPNFSPTSVPPDPNGAIGIQSGTIEVPSGNGSFTLQFSPVNNPNNLSCSVTYQIVNSVLKGPIANNDTNGCQAYPLLNSVAIGYNPFGGQDWNCGAGFSNKK